MSYLCENFGIIVIMGNEEFIKITNRQYDERIESEGNHLEHRLELEDVTEIMTEARITKQENIVLVEYDDCDDAGNFYMHNTLSIGEDCVNLSRFVSGHETEPLMVMEYEPDTTSITKYCLPDMPPLDIKLTTESITNLLDDDGKGKVFVEYRLKFADDFTRYNKLEIEIGKDK